MGLLLRKSCALNLCKAIPTFSKHFLVPVNLLESHTALCTTPTNSSLYLFIITGICIATYVQYANSTNSNACLGFSYLGHWVIWVSSCGPVSKLLCTLVNVKLNKKYYCNNFSYFRNTLYHMILDLVSLSHTSTSMTFVRLQLDISVGYNYKPKIKKL